MNSKNTVRLRTFCVVAAVALGSAGADSAYAQGPLAAPKGSIADIAAVLEQQKPPPERLAREAKQREVAAAQPPENADASTLADFYYRRGQVKMWINRWAEALKDGERALQYAKEAPPNPQLNVDLYGLLATTSFNNGLNGQSARYRQEQIKAANDAGIQGVQVSASKSMAQFHMLRNNWEEAEKWIARAEAYKQSFSALSGTEASRPRWEAEAEIVRADLAMYKGIYSEAESRYAKAHALLGEAIELDSQLLSPDQRASDIAYENHRADQNYRDNILSWGANAKRRQGRLLEAEADVRQALLNRLRVGGRNSPAVGGMTTTLTSILIEQGRHAEAARLAPVVLDIYLTLGVPADSTRMVGARHLVANTQAKIGQWKNTLEQYALIDAVVEKWPETSKMRVIYTPTRVLALLHTTDHDRALDTAEKYHKYVRSLLGDQHRDTALAEGYLAVAKTHKGATEAALEHFKSSAAILAASASGTDDDEAVGPSNFEADRRYILENYIAVLARARDADQQTAIESFNLADRMRGNAVNKALSASAAREAISDPRLAELARREQDLAKLIGTQFGRLNNEMAKAPERRDESLVKDLRAQVAEMRQDRTSVRKDIERGFPDYAALVDPQPPSVDEIRKSLRPGETFLSIFLGEENSFVWALPKDGAIAFTAAKAGAAEIEKRVKKLREALEPQAETLEEIPAFDLDAAHELYKLLLQPIEAAWKPAKSLVVTTNGALGLLPLGLLPTAPAQVAASQVMFEGYKTVPWLAKTHAVSMIPSASALKTLRNLTPGSKDRETMIGFGDPFFSEEQAKAAAIEVASAASAMATRGTPLKRRNASQTNGVASADLAMLPRLPDTTEELTSIALALQADPAKTLFLGKEANVRRVQKTDLTKYKVVVFATHGLVPGELEGLDQPALAMSAPSVADTDGDGLLTMGEILGLKLNADWVVLSACNTGAGSGAGAEAASGLGRAFFYAGTRALLVTNWSVHSVSARDLVSDLFARQSKDAGLSRAEALREAMVTLMSGPGFVEGGKTLFSYAHPLFWAPYSLIGDGGS